MKAICVHGHFYQPSREDPVTGIIPEEPGASPFQNWNELIHNRCYQPNATLGNFGKISFDIGPTLAGWMGHFDPETLARIIAQDRENVARFGVGNAIAQPYHHTILPLATLADKITQIRWGIADFEYHFGRKPQGIWLPEAGVDQETMEILADLGIQFTILAPWQAAADWVDVTHPYTVPLSGDRKLSVFFYDQDLSMRVSFDPESTINADHFLRNYVYPRYRTKTGSLEPQVLIIASDGELYGHHQPFRDKFLSHLTNHSLEEFGIELTYPALFLRDIPPRETITIRQNTSWSCHHGVARWKETCGCTPYGEWKQSLRQAMNKIAAALDQAYLRELSSDFSDPWELRHRYIEVLQHRISFAELVGELAFRPVEAAELVKIDLLLRAQFERQRMFTSCGWYFEDFDRIEPRNNVTYAAQAIWLNRQATGEDLYPLALEAFRPVRSWRSGLRGDLFFEQRYAAVRSNEDRAGGCEDYQAISLPSKS